MIVKYAEFLANKINKHAEEQLVPGAQQLATQMTQQAGLPDPAMVPPTPPPAPPKPPKPSTVPIAPKPKTPVNNYSAGLPMGVLG